MSGSGHALEERARDEGREKPQPKEQINFTDEESRIMRVEKQFEQAYNVQAAVDKRSQIILAALATQDHNDKELLETMIDRAVGTIGLVPDSVLADSGYFSEEQIGRVQETYKSVKLLVPPDREQHGKNVIAVRGRLPKEHLHCRPDAKGAENEEWTSKLRRAQNNCRACVWPNQGSQPASSKMNGRVSSKCSASRSAFWPINSFK